MNSLDRWNVRVSGAGRRAILFAHGYGCDQSMWRFVAPAFEAKYRVVLFDYVGAGRSDASAYNSVRYNSLAGYADDVLTIADELEFEGAIFVGHSVSAMIGALATVRSPRTFADLVMVGPSPRYIDDENYVGGFRREDIDDLLDSLANNYLGWSRTMAPVIMGNADRPELGDELANSFCRMDPQIANNFARVTFLSDTRAELRDVPARTLILQCRDDVIAPAAVGAYVHAQIPNSTLVHLRATGHCPNLSAPAETIACLREFLERSDA